MTLKDWHPAVRFFLTPLLWGSVGLHLLVVLLPLPDPPPPPELEPEPEAGIVTQVVRLEDLLLPEPQPTLVASSESPASATVEPMEAMDMAAAIAPPVPDIPTEAIAPPPPSLSPQTSPAPLPPPESPVPVSSPAPPPPAPDGLQTFIDTIQATSGSSDVPNQPVIPALFPQPDSFFDLEALENNSPQLKPEILRTALIANQSPDQVYVTMLISSLSDGFQSSQQADYGGGLMYEVTREDQTWYFNLVPATGDRGTVIVVWQQAPG